LHKRLSFATTAGSRVIALKNWTLREWGGGQLDRVALRVAGRRQHIDELRGILGLATAGDRVGGACGADGRDKKCVQNCGRENC
jgi:hypothetical protein